MRGRGQHPPEAQYAVHCVICVCVCVCVCVSVCLCGGRVKGAECKGCGSGEKRERSSGCVRCCWETVSERERVQ